MQKAKDVENKTHFGKEQAFFKVYSSKIASVFYFENPDPRKTLEAEFILKLENLVLTGDEAGESSFKIWVKPK